MGEALISRVTVIPEELLDPIYPVAGACVLSVKIVDSLNNPIENVPITCKDGSYSYTYNTNNKGMTRFTTNSGQPSIFLNNNLSNSVRILDHSSYWYNNIEGPIGSVVNKTFNMPYLSGLSISGGIGNGTEIYKNIFYGIFLATNYVSGNLRGGGGGGGGGIGAWLYSQHGNEIGGANGGNGGRGNQVIFNNIPVVKGEKYYVSITSGGAAGSSVTGYSQGNALRYQSATSGNSGSTAVFGPYSALGGGGGSGAWIEQRMTGVGAMDGTSGSSYNNGGNGGEGGVWTRGSTYVAYVYPGEPATLNLVFFK